MLGRVALALLLFSGRPGEATAISREEAATHLKAKSRIEREAKNLDDQLIGDCGSKCTLEEYSEYATGYFSPDQTLQKYHEWIERHGFNKCDNVKCQAPGTWKLEQIGLESCSCVCKPNFYGKHCEISGEEVMASEKVNDALRRRLIKRLRATSTKENLEENNLDECQGQDCAEELGEDVDEDDQGDDFSVDLFGNVGDDEDEEDDEEEDDDNSIFT